MYIIRSSKIKFYLRKLLKITNIMTIGLILIIAIILIKYKPAYKIIISGEEIGYVNNKEQFEKVLEEKLIKKDTKVASATIDEEITYEFKLASQEVKKEEELIEKIENNINVIYSTYAITLEGEIKAYVGDVNEANEIIEQIKEEKQEDLEIDLAVTEVFIQNIEELNSLDIEIAKIEIDEKINQIIEEENKIKESTVNGITLAVTPVNGMITSRYGSISRVRTGAHTGLDIATKVGTPIKACAEGEVTYSGYYGSLGYTIILSHGNGIQTVYGHCSKLVVSEGDYVYQGDKIAEVGSTGNSTGPHLHLEVIVDGIRVNPQNYLYK